MPTILAIRCPRCGAQARYEHAEIARISRKKNVDFFRKSKDFHTAKVQAPGGKANVAVLWHGLKRKDARNLPPLPREEKLKKWLHSDASYPRLDAGVAVCASCGLRRKHILDWPKDAWFQTEHRGHVLWAFTRAHAEELLRYVQATDRHRGNFRHHAFLMKVPAHFLTAKARDDVSKKLAALLKSS